MWTKFSIWMYGNVMIKTLDVFKLMYFKSVFNLWESLIINSIRELHCEKFIVTYNVLWTSSCPLLYSLALVSSPLFKRYLVCFIMLFSYTYSILWTSPSSGPLSYYSSLLPLIPPHLLFFYVHVSFKSLLSSLYT
jgi:hypothetical protein